MENINNFLLAAESMGCQKLDLFQTVDLYENQNIAQVTLYASEYFNSNFAWSGINETSNITTDLLLQLFCIRRIIKVIVVVGIVMIE